MQRRISAPQKGIGAQKLLRSFWVLFYCLGSAWIFGRYLECGLKEAAAKYSRQVQDPVVLPFIAAL